MAKEVIETRERQVMSLAEVLERTGTRLVFEQSVRGHWTVQLWGHKDGCAEVRVGWYSTKDEAVQALAEKLTGYSPELIFRRPMRSPLDLFRSSYLKLDLRRTVVSVVDERDAATAGQR